ncbi:hypothetical protein DDP32_04230 [Helicobacter pylori]|uniref:hypothetical protein n=1 Tax=Helicobacter pylori TaxID=210 RepID=UPI000EAF2DD3|nr:hypothetical protein [Helicobacter pylori]RKU89992.1 hypothetical protein DDP32_04230 [Helicobacter pylori]
MRAYYRFKQPKKSVGRGIKRSPFLAIISKENKENKIKLKEQIRPYLKSTLEALTIDFVKSEQVNQE